MKEGFVKQAARSSHAGLTREEHEEERTRKRDTH